MKNIRIFKPSFLMAVSFLFLFGGRIYAEDIKYNDVNDEELRKREADAKKNAKPGVADPYYENYIKNSWEMQKEEKAKQLIEDVKKDYGTDKFDKSTIEKGPKKDSTEDNGPKLYPTPPADPYYEENIKKSWNRKDEELKGKIVDTIKKEVDGKKSDENKPDVKTNMPGGDPYYEENIKNSWEQSDKEILEKAKKKIEEDNLIKKEKEEKK